VTQQSRQIERGGNLSKFLGIGFGFTTRAIDRLRVLRRRRLRSRMPLHGWTCTISYGLFVIVTWRKCVGNWDLVFWFGGSIDVVGER